MPLTAEEASHLVATTPEREAAEVQARADRLPKTWRGIKAIKKLHARIDRAAHNGVRYVYSPTYGDRMFAAALAEHFRRMGFDAHQDQFNSFGPPLHFVQVRL